MSKEEEPEKSIFEEYDKNEVGRDSAEEDPVPSESVGRREYANQNKEQLIAILEDNQDRLSGLDGIMKQSTQLSKDNSALKKQVAESNRKLEKAGDLDEKLKQVKEGRINPKSKEYLELVEKAGLYDANQVKIDGYDGLNKSFDASEAELEKVKEERDQYKTRAEQTSGKKYTEKEFTQRLEVITEEHLEEIRKKNLELSGKSSDMLSLEMEKDTFEEENELLRERNKQLLQSRADSMALKSDVEILRAEAENVQRYRQEAVALRGVKSMYDAEKRANVDLRARLKDSETAFVTLKDMGNKTIEYLRGQVKVLSKMEGD